MATPAHLLPPELMRVVFEQFGPKRPYPYKFEPADKNALRSCLVVSRYCREFAMHQLFRSTHIDIQVSSVPNLDLLLEILCPSSPRVQWMSALPHVQHFSLKIWCHRNDRFGLVQVEPGLLRLLSVLSGDQARLLTGLRISTCYSSHEWCHLTKALQTAVGNLLTMPHLQSLDIEGVGFLSPDFFRGTNICQLDVSSYNPYSYSRNPEMMFWSSHQPDEEMRKVSRVRSLTTDVSFPFKLESLAAKSLLGTLDQLNLYVRDNKEHIYSKTADILRLTTSLKALTLRYDELCSLPIVDWDTNFGDMQVLETLEISIWIGYLNALGDTDLDYMVPGGMVALRLLFAALNTIHQPMPRLAHIRWCYSLGMAYSQDLPFHMFEDWLRTYSEWRALDSKFTSDLFPVLSEVQLAFYLPRLYVHQTDDEGNTHLLAGLDADIATIDRVRHMREQVFPRSVTALGENFELLLK